jgi:transposase-like protein
VFVNRVLRRRFGSKRENVVRSWRRQYNEELLALYSSQNIIKVIRTRRM